MDIKAVIDKLQSIDANDLKNIDWRGLKDTLLSRPDLMIIVGCITVTVIGSTSLFASNQKKSADLKKEVRKLESQQEAAETNKTIKAQYDAYLADFPEERTVDEIVDTLSSYALEEKIKILSYTPALEDEEDYVIVNSFTISVVGENYQRILSFLKTIEDSPYALRLESWSGEYFQEEVSLQPVRRSSRRSRNPPPVQAVPEKKEGVKAEIELSLIKLKI